MKIQSKRPKSGNNSSYLSPTVPIVIPAKKNMKANYSIQLIPNCAKMTNLGNLCMEWEMEQYFPGSFDLYNETWNCVVFDIVIWMTIMGACSFSASRAPVSFQPGLPKYFEKASDQLAFYLLKHGSETCRVT